MIYMQYLAPKQSLSHASKCKWVFTLLKHWWNLIQQRITRGKNVTMAVIVWVFGIDAWKHRGHCSGIFGISCLFCSSSSPVTRSVMREKSKGAGPLIPFSSSFYSSANPALFISTTLRPQFEQTKRNLSPIEKPPKEPRTTQNTNHVDLMS